MGGSRMNTERLKELFAFLAGHGSIEELAAQETGKHMIIEAVPEAEVMFGFDQHSPWHCYDLWTHTAKTVDGLDDGLPEDLYRKLRIAAFFHDIGKPDTAMPKKTEDGSQHWSYPNHADRSAEISAPYLKELLPEEEVNEIMFYIAGHDLFMNLNENLDPSHRNYLNAANVRRLISRQKELYPEFECSPEEFRRMMFLSEADEAAHKEIVYEPDGSVKDTREAMVRRTVVIRKILKEELM